MPKLKFEQIERELSRARLAPIYLIYGPEEYLCRILVEKISDVCSAEMGAEIERHSALGLDVIKVVDGLKTLPMWSRGKLVVIGGAERLSVSAKEHLCDYCLRPAPSTVLVITGSKFDGRSRLYKLVDKAGVTVELKALYENQIPVWISTECRRRGYKISMDAACFMAELTGTDLAQVSGSIEKLILYIGKKKMIELADVETVLSDTSQKSIFDLTGAVGGGDLSRAANRLSNLLRHNESPVVVINMLARHLRLLAKAKDLMMRGCNSKGTFAKDLGVHPYFVKEYVDQAKRFDKGKIVEGIEKLWNADVAVKSSRMPKKEILYDLVMGLTK